MPVLPRSLEIQGEIAAIRRDIHAHPELAYEETRTSDIVAAKLVEWGLEVTRGLGKTGVVGTLRKGNSLKSIGLRADMDALPVMLGNGGGPEAASLHNPRYDFNDMAIPFGVSFFVRTVERFLEQRA